MVKIVPFPEFFGNQVKKEWANLNSTQQKLGLAKRFYSLAYHTMNLLQVPLVYAPVVAHLSGVWLPKRWMNPYVTL